MSWYYSYYPCIRHKDGTIDIMGVFDKDGFAHPCLCNSRSFEYGLHEEFVDIQLSNLTNDSIKALRINLDEWDEVERNNPYMSYCAYHDLPSGSYIKSGYFLVEDIDNYEEWLNNPSDIWFDGFYEKISTQHYMNLLQHAPKEALKYAFYMYADKECKEYHSSILNLFRDPCNVDMWNIKKEDGGEAGVFLWQG